jgi:hypothetical protein
VLDRRLLPSQSAGQRHAQGNAMPDPTLLNLAGFVNHLRYVEFADPDANPHQSWGHDEPVSSGLWPVLQAQSYALTKPREVGIVGERHFAGTQPFLRIVRESYRPCQGGIAPGMPDSQSPAVPLPPMQQR